VIKVGEVKRSINAALPRVNIQRMYFQTSELDMLLSLYYRPGENRPDLEDTAEEVAVSRMVQEALPRGQIIDRIIEYSRRERAEVGDIIAVLFQVSNDTVGLGMTARARQNNSRLEEDQKRVAELVAKYPMVLEDEENEEILPPALEELKQSSPKWANLLEQAKEGRKKQKAKRMKPLPPEPLKIEEPKPREAREDLWGDE
jgi:hypothetical protein